MKKVWLYGYVVCLTAGLLAAGCAGKEKKPEKPVEPAAVEEEAAPAEEAVIEVEPAKPEELSKENGLLTVDKPVYDFGELEPKKKFQGEYVLKNEGKAALEIQNPVRKSCGCTELKLDKYKLEPGESALLKVVYTSNSSPGETEKHIWVDVVPPGQPKTLTLKPPVGPPPRETLSKPPISTHRARSSLPGRLLPSIERSRSRRKRGPSAPSSSPSACHPTVR